MLKKKSLVFIFIIAILLGIACIALLCGIVSYQTLIV